jgi:hypothetical protein
MKSNGWFHDTRSWVVPTVEKIQDDEGIEQERPKKKKPTAETGKTRRKE